VEQLNSPTTLDVIIASPRDQRTFDYLVETCGLGRVEHARSQLLGRTKPYVSNIAKILGVAIPDDVLISTREDGRKQLAEIKKLLSYAVKSI
jgi:hypothetical protein